METVSHNCEIDPGSGRKIRPELPVIFEQQLLSYFFFFFLFFHAPVFEFPRYQECILGEGHGITGLTVVSYGHFNYLDYLES